MDYKSLYFKGECFLCKVVCLPVPCRSELYPSSGVCCEKRGCGQSGDQEWPASQPLRQGTHVHHQGGCGKENVHYNEVMMSTMASQITSLTIVYSTVYSSTDQRKHQSSASLAFVWGIHRWPVNSLHKGPVTRKCFDLMTSSWKHSFEVNTVPVYGLRLPFDSVRKFEGTAIAKYGTEAGSNITTTNSLLHKELSIVVICYHE